MNKGIFVILSIIILVHLVVFLLVIPSFHISIELFQCINSICDITNWFTFELGIIAGTIIAIIIWKKQGELKKKQNQYALKKLILTLLSIQHRLHNIETIFGNVNETDWKTIQVTEITIQNASKLEENSRQVVLELITIAEEKKEMEETIEKYNHVIEPKIQANLENMSKGLRNIHHLERDKMMGMMKNINNLIDELFKNRLKKDLEKIPTSVKDNYKNN